MTKAQAIARAAEDRVWVARPYRDNRGWGVWDSYSDHWVEFDEPKEPNDRRP